VRPSWAHRPRWRPYRAGRRTCK